MVLEQVAGLDRLLVAAIDQNHAVAVQVDEGKLGHGLGSGRQQGRHLGTCGVRVLRPAGGLADIGVCDGCVTGDFREQRRFLGTAHDKRLSARRRGAEFFKFGPAELTRGQDLSAPTAPLHGRAVERHRVFARANQNLGWPIGHLVSDLQSRMWACLSVVMRGLDPRLSIRFARTAFAKDDGTAPEPGSADSAFKCCKSGTPDFWGSSPAMTRKRRLIASAVLVMAYSRL